MGVLGMSSRPQHETDLLMGQYSLRRSRITFLLTRLVKTAVDSDLNEPGSLNSAARPSRPVAIDLHRALP